MNLKESRKPVGKGEDERIRVEAIRGESAIVAQRFCGPPQSANGGYVCGLAAEFMRNHDGRTVQAKIKSPAPLETPLEVSRLGDSVALTHGNKQLVEVRPVDRDLIQGLPDVINFEEAKRYSTGYVGFERHFFPKCFVCGPARTAGDGMHIFCGPVADDVVAGTWIPDASLGSTEGIVAPRYLWAALDCPGGAAALNGRSARLIVLVKLEAQLVRPATVGSRYVVMGWKKKITGRRNLVGSAIFDAGGSLVAVAEGLWLEAAGWEESNQAKDWQK